MALIQQMGTSGGATAVALPAFKTRLASAVHPYANKTRGKVLLIAQLCLVLINELNWQGAACCSHGKDALRCSAVVSQYYVHSRELSSVVMHGVTLGTNGHFKAQVRASNMSDMVRHGLSQLVCASTAQSNSQLVCA